jgi:hypothetical protein
MAVFGRNEFRQPAVEGFYLWADDSCNSAEPTCTLSAHCSDSQWDRGHSETSRQTALIFEIKSGTAFSSRSSHCIWVGMNRYTTISCQFLGRPQGEIDWETVYSQNFCYLGACKSIIIPCVVSNIRGRPLSPSEVWRSIDAELVTRSANSVPRRIPNVI